MKYQKNFSELTLNKNEYIKTRKAKGEKILSVLSDYFDNEISNLKVLEIGCFTGRISNLLAPNFKEYYAIDIDTSSLNIAKSNNTTNVFFENMSADDLNFKDENFDIVICSHVYEHVPDANIMMDEIFRVLKYNGICYFAAANKISLFDPEYNLLFASLLPKPIANKYLKIFRGIPEYYETFSTLTQLKKLVSKFHLLDYTRKILNSPEKFNATEMLQSNSIFKKIVCSIAGFDTTYYIFPTYIWILKKENK